MFLVGLQKVSLRIVTGDPTAVTIMDRWLGKPKQEAGETEGETGGLSPSGLPRASSESFGPASVSWWRWGWVTSHWTAKPGPCRGVRVSESTWPTP